MKKTFSNTTDLEKRFITTLIDKTNSKLIHWDYLDQNNFLLEKLDIKVEPVFKDDCFYLTNEDSFFVITHFYEYYAFNEYSEEYMLYIIPNTFRNIKKISSEDEEYCELLIRLDNVIKNTFPNPEDIMEEFISTNDFPF